MVKLLGLTILIIGIVGASYWYGVEVGGERLALHRIAISASDAVDDAEILRNAPAADPLEMHDMRIDEALIAYGRYLESRRLAVGLAEIDEATQFMFEQVARYRRKYPGTMEVHAFPEIDSSSVGSEEVDELRVKYEEEQTERIRYYGRALRELGG